MVASDETNSHHKTIALFDVDGTLTVPRKVYTSGAITFVLSIMTVTRNALPCLHPVQYAHSVSNSEGDHSGFHPQMLEAKSDSSIQCMRRKQIRRLLISFRSSAR